MGKISIGRGFRQQRAILPPENRGMAMIAKNRIENVVAAQNANHMEALKVQGSDLKIWVRTFAGQKCSCCTTGGQTQSNPDKTIFIDPFNDITTSKRNFDISDGNEIPQSYQNPMEDDVEAMSDEEFIDSITSDDTYAIGDENSIIYGGDKTPCGICLGTGYKNGYQMYNGNRIVLDYWNNPVSQGFMLEKTYPYSYTSNFDSSNYIIWSFEAPTFFKDFLGLRVRNNLSYCKDYKLEISFDGIVFMEYDDALIKSRKGKETQIFLKVIPYDHPLSNSVNFTITHIELYYQMGDYIKGDFAPIADTENFELFEALQTTSLELAGDIAGLSRESVILDDKNHKLWKVISITPHMTEARQIFKNEIELRQIQPSENLYLLNLLENPYIILNTRGLEQRQGKQTYFGEYNP